MLSRTCTIIQVTVENIDGKPASADPFIVMCLSVGWDADYDRFSTGLGF